MTTEIISIALCCLGMFLLFFGLCNGCPVWLAYQVYRTWRRLG